MMEDRVQGRLVFGRVVVIGVVVVCLFGLAGGAYGGVAMVNYRISASADDTYASTSSSHCPACPFLEIGTGGTDFAVPFPISGLRFRNVEVGRGMRIVGAVLNISGGTNFTHGKVYGVIQAEASDNGADFSSRNIADANKTTASVEWDHLEDWVTNGWLISPDISGVVQEVVDRPGWSFGNSMVIIYGTRAKSSFHRQYSARDRSSGYAPLLSITYEFYNISGHITGAEGGGVSGVTVSGDGDLAPAISDANGYYELQVPPGWSGTVTVSKTGWNITPSSRSYSNVISDQEYQDYTAFQPKISGYITDGEGTGLDGVSVTADNGGGTDTTDAGGYYEITVPYGWSGTVTPDKLGTYFVPHHRTYSDVNSNMVDEDYATGPGMGTTIRYWSSASNDNAFAINSGTQYTTTYYLEIGYDGEESAPYRMAAMRFNNIRIPQGATINEARFHIVPYTGTLDWPPMYGVLHAEATDNAANFGSRHIGGINKTSASVDWDHLEDWPSPQWDSSTREYIPIVGPDISSVVQEVVNRPGWSWGNSVVITYSSRLNSGKARRIGSNRMGSRRSRFKVSCTYERSVLICGYIESVKGGAISGVEVSCDNDGGSGTTDTNGYYEVWVAAGWSGTVSVNKEGWDFVPMSRIYSGITADQQNQDYTGLPRLKISGYIKDPNGDVCVGATVATEDGFASTVTDGTGFYELMVPYDWSGVVTPTKDWCVFSPENMTYSQVTEDQPGQDYTAFPMPGISGYIKTREGSGVRDVLVSADTGGGSGITNSGGYYEFRVSYGWSGTVVPSLSNGIFVPQERSYENLVRDMTDEDYTAVLNPVKTDMYQVSSTRDAAWSGGSGHQRRDTSLLEFGYCCDRALPYSICAMRFLNVNILRGADITGAYLHVKTRSATQSGSTYGQIHGEAADDVNDFVSRHIGSIPWTEAGVDWDPPRWDGYGWENSPGISSIIEEIVNRPGWSAGNAVVIVCHARLQSGSQRYFYGPSPGYMAWAPKLYISYECPKIFGYIKTSHGIGMDGVVVSADNGGGISTTYSNGYYVIGVAPGWSGVVSVSKDDWVFEPESRPYFNIDGDEPGQDYVGFAPLMISGYIETGEGVGTEGVVVSAENGLGSDTTDANGYYAIMVPYKWSGALSVSKPLWGFEPPSRSYSDVTEDLPNQDFAAVGPVAISGQIRNSEDIGTEGVLVSASNGGTSNSTDDSGSYEVLVPYGWSGTITASKGYWVFEPPDRSYFDVTYELLNENYLGIEPVRISGFVATAEAAPVAGVLLSPAAGESGTTDANGYYEVFVPYNWAGTVRPYRLGWVFEPVFRSYSGVVSEVAFADYTAWFTGVIRVRKGMGGDFRRIQEAIDSAELNFTIIVGPGRYYENVNFRGNDVVLTSEDPNDDYMVRNTIIDANGSGSAVTFGGSESNSCVLTGFSVTGGRTSNGGGIRGHGTDATIANSIISKNLASQRGGGIYNCDGIISNCIISENTAYGGIEDTYGGGLWGCDGTVTNCTITGNWAFWGGGAHGCNGTIKNCIISGNRSSRFGGGLGICEGTIINCTIVGNSASSDGTVSYCSGPIINCIIWGNTSQLYNSSTPTYSCIQGWSSSASGNINADPLFAREPDDGGDGWWDSVFTPDVDESANNDYGDLHLKSEAGRWEPDVYADVDLIGDGMINLLDFSVLADCWQQEEVNPACDLDNSGVVNLSDLAIFLDSYLTSYIPGGWVFDDANTSPCVDAGDPNSDWTGELWPHGRRINMGGYGGSKQASKSQSDIGNIASLVMDEMWMYQNLPGQSNSDLTASVSITADPMGNSSYSYEWEIVLPGDVNLAPVTVAGGGAGDAYWTFAARGCDEPGGLSDSGQTFTVRVTVTGDDYGNTGQAEAEFGIALLGDVNNDGVVNVADRAIANAFWVSGSAGPYTLRDCDVNCDGVVNVADRAIANAIWVGGLGQKTVSNPCPLR